MLTVIGLISGGLLAETYKFATPLIEGNRRLEMESSIVEVLPGSESFKIIDIDGQKVYQGYDGNGERTGIAFLVEGNGFQGVINMMVGLESSSGAILGLKVLEHSETPGLGARINEEWFLEQFKGKTKEDSFSSGNDLDAITGATVSSKAVMDGLKKGLEDIQGVLSSGKLVYEDRGN